MNLNQLKYFYTVCVCGSLSEASEHLYISQPSLSSAIKSLENEFGIILFNRHHKGMRLTNEGKLLFEMSRDILSRTEQLEGILNDVGKKRNKLRIGVPPMIGSLVLPHILRDFYNIHPNINLKITEGGSNELSDKLNKNYLDMVFLAQNNSHDEHFSTLRVANLEIVCCVSKNNPISQYKYITPDILKNTPLVLFENNFFQTEEIKKWFESGNTNPNIILQTEQLSTMISMIAEDVSVGFAFRQLAQKNDFLIAIPLKNPIYVDVILAWKKESYYLNSMEKFKEFIKSNNPFETV